ncbi:hypothetical protein MHBO_000629 [Bonamia ostreae]|uniref:Uncharacterized protein n=1 Tax=Bonamia ostreae TaxID=126728 RepID=A0ABV2AGD2_9EUKA
MALFFDKASRTGFDKSSSSFLWRSLSSSSMSPCTSPITSFTFALKLSKSLFCASSSFSLTFSSLT